MPYSIVPDLVAPSRAQSKPILSSYDSGQEFSLVHWLEIRNSLNSKNEMNANRRVMSSRIRFSSPSS